MDGCKIAAQNEDREKIFGMLHKLPAKRTARKFFGAMKHGERRSGRKNLGKDLEHLPAERTSKYMETFPKGSIPGWINVWLERI
jgi:hypothetical protein